MNNDQWFSPGDKVMLVEDFGLDDPEAPFECRESHPQKGHVYCVSEVDNSSSEDEINLISLLGFKPLFRTEDGGVWGWAASHFRRVEEIRLCINAVKKTKEPQLV